MSDYKQNMKKMHQKYILLVMKMTSELTNKDFTQE